MRAIFLLILCFAATPALAKKGPRTPRTPSSEERKGKGYTLDLQPLTLFVGGVGSGASTGASFGAFLGPDLILRATYRAGNSCAEERCAYAERSTSIALQQFVSNSFFVEVGAMTQRNVYHPVEDYYYDQDDRDSSFTYNAETRGATIAIGNQWQWKAFTFGARWAAAYQPLQLVRSSVHADDPEKYQVGPDERKEKQRLEREGKFYLPSLMIGYSF